MNLSNIAAQLFTVREFTKTEQDLREALRKISEIGYKAVQVSAIGHIAPAIVKQIADEYGLQICATHISYQRLTTELEQVISEHKLWGCEYVGLGMIPQEFSQSAEGYRAFLKIMAPIAATLHDQGLTFVYHNHKFEFERVEAGHTGMDILINESDPAHFGLELDLYWAHAGGADAAQLIRRTAGRMAVVHLKDMAIIADQQVFAEIGEGNMNYPLLIEECRQSGVLWYVVEQDICRRDPFESLAISYIYLRALARV